MVDVSKRKLQSLLCNRRTGQDNDDQPVYYGSSCKSFEPTSDDILDSHNFDTGAMLNADSTTRIQQARLFGIIEAGRQLRTPK